MCSLRSGTGSHSPLERLGLLGADGHPRKGGFLPPVDLPRRMFAGGRATFHRPLTVGATTRREAEVTNVAEKTGRSGRLVIVDVTYRLFNGSGDLAVEEVQNLVYRPAAERPVDSAAAQPSTPAEVPVTQPVPGPPLHRSSDTEWSFRTDPSLLARFSAATANAHRIHYDWPYATREEGYPGLVVHGPLQALTLLETHRLAGGAPITSLTHRGLAPLFCGQAATLVTTPADGGAALALYGPGGVDAGPNATVDLTF
ncbi:MaoC family dehydratase N-terminal domain-containing protein [Tsukamurella sp. PLM1]|uniref:FAS1-like dehydratase domain-containing protein n=1 Tax=Tsukamurella sp. PLM1 TaxID=2929795 RepID=UPI0020476110|nr:mesaconyl-C(4)-CoA hydratase [Tsukamurella sp. PLM1]